MTESAELLRWLRDACAEYDFDIVAVFRASGDHSWPIAIDGPDELESELRDGGNFLPLPKEPAALANVIEVSVVDFLISQAAAHPGVEIRRGTERGYPDLELSGEALGGGFHAVDIKVARRAASGRRTQSRITLYTGNTYFRYPELQWPGTFRPFDEYASHADVVALYTLDEAVTSRVRDLELIVHEPWRIASRQRSSTTREYIGAVQRIEDLREGRGEFETEAEFYEYWRRFAFRIGPAVEQQLRRLLAEQEG